MQSLHNHGLLEPRRNHHIEGIENLRISKLAPFSGLILSVVCVVLFLFRYFFFESFIMPRYYGAIYSKLSENNRRGFVNHHIAGIVKVMLLVVASYPFIDTVFGKSTFRAPYAGSRLVTMGDVLVVCTQIFVGIYIFEIFYRPKISFVSMFHHIGTIVIAQAAIAISLNLVSEKDANIEFALCLIWGAFDCVCESIPHLSVVLYRVYPDRHHFLRRLFFIATVVTFSGTLFETAVIFYVFGTLWNRWTLGFKIVTPLLHVAFSITQLHGSRILLLMALKQNRLLHEKSGKDVEAQKADDSKAEAIDDREPSHETKADV